MGTAALSTAPASAAQLLAAARAEANATTQGPLSQLAGQIAAQNRQNANAIRDVSGYFKGLGTDVNQAGQAVQGIGTGLQSQLAGLSQSEQGQLSGIDQAAQQSLQAYLPKGDASVGDAGGQALTNALAQQAGYATQNMGALQGVGAEQAANYNDLVQGLKGAYAKQGQQDLSTIAQAGESALSPLTQKIATLEGERPTLAENDLVKLRQQEIDNNYHNNQINIADQLAGVKQQDANTLAQRNQITATNDQQRNKIAWQNALTAANKQSATAAYQKALAGTAATKANTAASEAPALNAYRLAEANKANAAARGVNAVKPLPPASNNTMISQLGAAVRRAQLMQKQGDSPQQIQEGLTLGGKSTSALTLNGVQLKDAYGQPRYSVSTVKGLGDPALVQAALELAQSNSISHQTWTQLHQLGIHSLPFKVAAPVK